MTSIPKYTEFDLLQILHHETIFPHGDKAPLFKNELVNNTKLKWKLNPFLLKKTRLRLLVNDSFYNLWRNLKNLNWMIVFSIIGFSVIQSDYKLLFLLITFPLLTALEVMDNRIIIANIVIILGVKYFFHLQDHYFWFFFDITAVAWLLNKVTQTVIRSVIFKTIFADFTTFWKYFSNKLIYLDRTGSNKEYQRLIAAYPELKKYCCGD